MSNIWQETEDQEFRDVPEEVTGQQAQDVIMPEPKQVKRVPAQQAPVNVSDPEPVHEETEEVEIDEDFTNVLNDARLRLEQGRLYEMILNHNLFEGTDADPIAIRNVQKEIRSFAKERMEIMLGMKSEKVPEPSISLDNFPFNDLEIRTLKSLAAAATKGATQAPEAQVFSGSIQVPKVGLNPISKPAKVTPAPIKQVNRQPMAKTAQTPVKRPTVKDPVVERILKEEGITREEYDKVFDPNYKPLDKDPNTMTENEIIERNKRAALRKQVTSSSALPMPPQEQIDFMYANRVQAENQNPMMQRVMGLLTNPKK
jgi:hypothetical protein